MIKSGKRISLIVFQIVVYTEKAYGHTVEELVLYLES